MKCKGINKSETRKLGKTQYCNTDLHPHQIYCHVCGEPTPALKTDLSAAQNFSQSWQTHKNKYPQKFGLGLLLTLVVYFPIAIIVFLFRGNYWMTNLALLFIVPLAMIPFAQKNDLTIKKFLSCLKYYPHYWLFVLLAEIYFFILKVICTGYLLDIMVDPVLHIVRLIMVLYGIACVIPVPLLIGEKNRFVVVAIFDSIKAGHETRWQQFFIVVQVFVINVIGVVCLAAGLLFTLPLSYQIIRNYYLKMDEYELFISPNPILQLNKKQDMSIN